MEPGCPREGAQALLVMMETTNKNRHQLYEYGGWLCQKIREQRIKGTNTTIVRVFWLSGPDRGAREKIVKEHFQSHFERVRPKRDKERLAELIRQGEKERRLKKVRYES